MNHYPKNQVQHLKNKKLRTIKKSYLGNKNINGRFVEYVSEAKGMLDLIKWKMDENAKYDGYALEVDKSGKFLSEKSDYIVWLGHASLLIQIDGKRLITDPCLTSPYCL